MRPLRSTATALLVSGLLAAAVPGASSAFTAATTSTAATTTATTSTWFRCADAAADARAAHRALLVWSLQDGSAAAVAGRGTAGAAAGGVWEPGTAKGSTTDGPCSRDVQTTGSAGRAVTLVAGARGAQSQYATGFAADAVLSVQLWFRTSTHQGLLFGLRQSSPAPGVPPVRDRVVFLDGTGRVVAGVAPAGSAHVIVRSPAGTDWADGRWHHVALTQSAAGLRLYLDGELRASDPTATRGFAYSQANPRTGQDDLSSWSAEGAGDGQFIGDLAWFSAYQSELTAQEVLEQCRAGRTAQSLVSTAPSSPRCSP